MANELDDNSAFETIIEVAYGKQDDPRARIQAAALKLTDLLFESQSVKKTDVVKIEAVIDHPHNQIDEPFQSTFESTVLKDKTSFAEIKLVRSYSSAKVERYQFDPKGPRLDVAHTPRPEQKIYNAEEANLMLAFILEELVDSFGSDDNRVKHLESKII